MTVPSEDSDQPGHLPSPIGVFAVRMKKPWVHSNPLSIQQRHWSDWADAGHFVGFVKLWLINCALWSKNPLLTHWQVLKHFQTIFEFPNQYNSEDQNNSNEMSHLVTKPTKWHVRPAKTQISLGIRPVWSESLLCTQWVAKDPSFLHADREDSDQTGWMPRLTWVFAVRTCHFVGFVTKWLNLCPPLAWSHRGATEKMTMQHLPPFHAFCLKVF